MAAGLAVMAALVGLVALAAFLLGVLLTYLREEIHYHHGDDE